MIGMSKTERVAIPPAERSAVAIEVVWKISVVAAMASMLTLNV